MSSGLTVLKKDEDGNKVGYKGTWRRPSNVSTEEQELRYKLIFSKSKKEKAEIRKKLKEFKERENK